MRRDELFLAAAADAAEAVEVESVGDVEVIKPEWGGPDGVGTPYSMWPLTVVMPGGGSKGPLSWPRLADGGTDQGPASLTLCMRPGGVATLGGRFPFKVSKICSCIIVVLSITHDHFNGNLRRVRPMRLV